MLLLARQRAAPITACHWRRSAIDEPVDQLADLPLDLLRRIRDDLLLELLLHAARFSRSITRPIRSVSSKKSWPRASISSSTFSTADIRSSKPRARSPR